MSTETIDNEVKLGTLTKDDLKALRTCSYVSFHQHNDGEGVIRCTKRIPAHKRQVFDPEERTHELRVCTSVRHFRGDGSLKFDTRFNCHSLVYNYCNEGEWATIAAMLKVGDVVSLNWVGADNNGTLKEADSNGEKIYHDRLYLKVSRGKKHFTFYVDDSVCKNNTARMVRPV